MDKKFEYGKWIPLEEGSMPEDLLPVHEFGKEMFTDEVIVPKMWGNEYGGGSYYPAYRYKKKNNSIWHWSFKASMHGYPLYWMALPPLPGSDNRSDDFVKRVIERMNREREEERRIVENRYEKVG